MMEFNDLMFTFGFLAALAIIFICWLIYRYYKWVYKVNDTLISVRCKLDNQECYIDNLKARVKRLEDRTNNIPYSEEGKGSINPSEADTVSGTKLAD